ncbi:MAG: hypothetical protein L0Z62_02915 [Gemmataceae bacterium]|nr:hypothetical protein [Gemmataceae bacterium]
MKRFALLAVLLFVPFLMAGAPPATFDRKAYLALDAHALKATRKTEQSLEDLAKYLTKTAKSDHAKARAIYRWITDRIAYDAEGFYANQFGDNSTEAVLKNRKCVCAGFANLFHDLCQAAGLEVVKVRGKTKGVYDPEAEDNPKLRHAWNAVKLGAKWYLVDPTWGAGALRDKKFAKRFREQFFLAAPEQLIFTHFPNDPKWQLLSEPIAEEDFQKQPKVNGRLFEMGVSPKMLRKAIQDKNFSGTVVKPFDHPGTPVLIREAPLDGSLRAGTTYRFRFETTSFTGMGFKHEKRVTYLARRGNVFEGAVVAPRGTLTVVGYIPRPGELTRWSVLEYVTK